MDERRTVISEEAFERARRDPKVKALSDAAKHYWQELVKRGHCPCHGVKNCPLGCSK